MLSKSSKEAASEGPTVIHICFCKLSNIPVAARTTNPDMEQYARHAKLSGRFIDTQSNLRIKNFII